MKDKHMLFRGFILLGIVLGMIVIISGCGIDRRFLLDSQRAIMDAAGDYLAGCRQVSLAPKLSLDWKGEVKYGGGIFAGCEESGRLVQFYCEMESTHEAESDAGLNCKALETWRREVD